MINKICMRIYIPLTHIWTSTLLSLSRNSVHYKTNFFPNTYGQTWNETSKIMYVAVIRAKDRKYRGTPKHALGEFSLPNTCFSQIHIDVVCSLPQFDSLMYLLMKIDRFSRWPDATTITHIPFKAICSAIFKNWISRFVCPSVITTD